MLDIKVQYRKARRTAPYWELKMTVYGAEFDFGLLDKEEAKAFAETLRQAAYELDPGGERE